MKIAVTGGAGFIGSHLCERLLSEGHQVISIDNFNNFYDPAIKKRNITDIQKHRKAKNFKSLRADIRNKNAARKILKTYKPDLVIHLAAMAGVRPSFENPSLYEDVNIRGTQVLLDACLESRIKNFIFGSSSSVYGNNAKVPFSEKDPIDKPISVYAVTKKIGETLCRTYHELYDKNICVLRFFTVYGPRQRPDLAIHKFTRLILEDQTIPFYGDGKTGRDYTYIDDIVNGILKAVSWISRKKKKPVYEIFNLGGSKPVSLTRLVSCIEKSIEKKGRIKKLPMQKGDVQRTFADISKSKRVLGYRSVTNLEAGIARFVEWYRQGEAIP